MITKIPEGWRIVTDGNGDRFWIQFYRSPARSWSLHDRSGKGEWVDYEEEHAAYDGTDWFRIEFTSLESARQWLLGKLNDDADREKRAELSKHLVVALQGGYDDGR